MISSLPRSRSLMLSFKPRNALPETEHLAGFRRFYGVGLLLFSSFLKVSNIGFESILDLDTGYSLAQDHSEFAYIAASWKLSGQDFTSSIAVRNRLLLNRENQRRYPPMF